MTIHAYEQKWGREPGNNFAVACYDENSREDLERALRGEADAEDMREWGISAEEWREAIQAAQDEHGWLDEDTDTAEAWQAQRETYATHLRALIHLARTLNRRQHGAMPITATMWAHLEIACADAEAVLQAEAREPGR